MTIDKKPIKFTQINLATYLNHSILHSATYLNNSILQFFTIIYSFINKLFFINLNILTPISFTLIIKILENLSFYLQLLKLTFMVRKLFITSLNSIFFYQTIRHSLEVEYGNRGLFYLLTFELSLYIPIFLVLKIALTTFYYLIT